jgi:hypothetical protein
MAWSTSDLSLGNSPLTHHTTMEELLEVMFSVWPNPKLYNNDQRNKLVSWEMTVEAMISCEIAANWQGCEHESWGIYTVGSYNLTMASEGKLRRLSLLRSEKLSAWISDSAIITCSKDL